jgi:hypothetical protein
MRDWQPSGTTPEVRAEAARLAPAWRAALRPASPDELAAVLGRLRVHYASGRAALDAGQWRVLWNDYARLLGDVPADILSTAADRHLLDPQRGAFWPKVGELRAHADKLLAERRIIAARLERLAVPPPPARPPEAVAAERARIAAGFRELLAGMRARAAGHSAYRRLHPREE